MPAVSVQPVITAPSLLGVQAAPTQPVISVTPGDAQNVVALTSGGTGATSYDIKWGTVAGTRDNTISGVTLPYTHTGRTNGTEYFYSLVAINGAGSVESAEVSGTPVASSPAYFTDFFTGNDGDAFNSAYWDAATASNVSADSTFDIRSNALHVNLKAGASPGIFEHKVTNTVPLTAGVFVSVKSILPSSIWSVSIPPRTMILQPAVDAGTENNAIYIHHRYYGANSAISRQICDGAGVIGDLTNWGTGIPKTSTIKFKWVSGNTWRLYINDTDYGTVTLNGDWTGGFIVRQMFWNDSTTTALELDMDDFQVGVE